MDWATLKDTITTDNRYKSICKSVTKNSHLWEELYQESMLITCLPNMKVRLLEAVEGGFLEVYITGIIHQQWLTRFKVKIFKQNTSPYYLIADHSQPITERSFVSDYSRERILANRAVVELFKKMKSKDSEERESAFLLWEVCKSNSHTISQEKKTSRYQINKQIAPILKDLKRKLNE